MKPYDYLIVGSGLSGAVFANAAASRGKKCLVLEKRGHIAGNCYDEPVSGILVHRYGAHIFHTSDEEVWAYVRRFADFNHYINSPVANYHGEIYNLPFNMNTFSRLWGVATPREAAQILELQRVEYDHEPQNVEEQALNIVGKDVFKKLIMCYTEKQWGRPCSELPASILKRIPVRFTYDNNYFDDPYQGVPVGGYTRMVERMLEGVQVQTNTDYLRDRDYYDSQAERVFYTGAPDAFFENCLGSLQYRSLRFEDELLDTPNHQGVAVMNYTDGETPYTRIIEHKHFTFGRQPNTVITREYPTEWRPGAEPCYPINDEANQSLARRYMDMAGGLKNVIFCGRLAQYRYCNMDQAIRAALDVAKSELS